MTFDAYYNLKIKLPNLINQQKIASVLSALDDKIELNNKINVELEAMAKTIYDYWFVQFDFPDTNRKPYRSSGGAMVYNETLKREIPRGWEVKELGEIADIFAGGDKPNDISAIKSGNYKIPIFSNGIQNEGLYGYTNQEKIVKQSITISARGTIGYCFLRNEPFYPIIRLLTVTPLIEYYIYFLYEYLRYVDFEYSGSVQQQLTVPQIKHIPILSPPQVIMKVFFNIYSEYSNCLENNKKQNQELASLRDWLLPMLLNGQVGFKEEKRM